VSTETRAGCSARHGEGISGLSGDVPDHAGLSGSLTLAWAHLPGLAERLGVGNSNLQLFRRG